MITFNERQKILIKSLKPFTDSKLLYKKESRYKSRLNVFLPTSHLLKQIKSNIAYKAKAIIKDLSKSAILKAL
jgi:hypothetical protein